MWPASRIYSFFTKIPVLTVVEVYLEILDAKEAFHDFDNLRHMVPLYHEKGLITY
jgi:hypothetical protein